MSAKQKGGSKNDATDKYTQALRDLQVSMPPTFSYWTQFRKAKPFHISKQVSILVKRSSFLTTVCHNKLWGDIVIQARCAENKLCFECRQRGPTYVDVTIGSFVCSKCSGVLRGITPPHRIKSISMSSFSTEEVESIRTRGKTFFSIVKS